MNIREEQMIDLSGKVAIVTGAGRGLGRSHALLLAGCGAQVVGNDLGNEAESVAREIKDVGGAALAVKGSVTDVDFVHQMVNAALEAWGRVDILVNNAGILHDKSFAKMDMQDFRSVIEVHLMGTANCVKAVWE